MSKIIPFREEIFHQINQILESQKAFIFLWGKSGSGKSVLLQRLAKKYNVDFINENFKDQSFLKEKIEFLIFLEPMMTLFVALLVLFLALGIFLPMWELSSGVNFN